LPPPLLILHPILIHVPHPELAPISFQKNKKKTMNKKKSRPNTAGQPWREIARAVREIFRGLESRPADRDCISRTECCRFRLTGRTPQLTRGEALVAAAGWRAAGKKTIPEAGSADGACPFLKTGGCCAIYDSRPFGCRTHFCDAAGGMIPRRQVIDLIRRLEAIDEKIGGDGPKPLPGAVADVWEIVTRKPGRRVDG
jgi:Fe-S-cluster containining protein